MEKSKQDYINKLTQSHVITPDGRDWLTLALDPFHDYNHPVAGYPDADVSQTVVQCFQYQTDVTAPAGVVGNWDCHVYNLPQAVTSSFNVGTLDSTWATQTQANPGVNSDAGLLNIVSVPAGNPLSPTVPVIANSAVECLPAANVLTAAGGISRVIGMGFEVTNTTAEIYRQGSVTTYRMPQTASDYQMVFSNNAATRKGVVIGEQWREVPATLADANLLKGTRTWAAGEGLYATVMQNSIHNPMHQLAAKQIMYVRVPTPGTGTVARWTGPGLNAPENAAPALTPLTFSTNKSLPFDTTGAMFTGLSNQTILTVKLRVYVERAPTFAEPDMAILASPSAGYDVRALELYAQAVNMLPPAVKVGENAKGDWWRAIISVLKAVAIPAGMAAAPFFPMAPIAGALVNHVAGQLKTSDGASLSNQVGAIARKQVDLIMNEQKKKQRSRKAKLPALPPK